MDINKLKAFVAVCNTGSYTKVAKSFGYTHAGISYMIKSLEDEVGFSLLEKKGTSRIPTANARKILPDILNTLYIIIATLIFVLPLGVCAAIYLTEYATNQRLAKLIEDAAETLSGIPSVIYGLEGMLFFCQFLSLQTSLLAGSLTLVIMNLPTVMRTTQESLKTVPQSYREGAFALGAGKWRVIRTVVLPCCVDGVLTGCILSVGRIVGESAALLLTAGFAHAVNDFFTGLGSAGASLSVALYVYAKEQGEFEAAFAIAAILMLLTMCINLAATLIG